MENLRPDAELMLTLTSLAKSIARWIFRMLPSWVGFSPGLAPPVLSSRSVVWEEGKPKMYFQDCSGWQCQLLEADLQTSLRRQMHFASSDKLVEFVERGGGFKDQEARMMFDQGIEKGKAGVFLSLTDEQYAELNR
jgi:hypothetical protein